MGMTKRNKQLFGMFLVAIILAWLVWATKDDLEMIRPFLGPIFSGFAALAMTVILGLFYNLAKTTFTLPSWMQLGAVQLVGGAATFILIFLIILNNQTVIPTEKKMARPGITVDANAQVAAWRDLRKFGQPELESAEKKRLQAALLSSPIMMGSKLTFKDFEDNSYGYDVDNIRAAIVLNASTDPMPVEFDWICTEYRNDGYLDLSKEWYPCKSGDRNFSVSENKTEDLIFQSRQLTWQKFHKALKNSKTKNALLIFEVSGDLLGPEIEQFGRTVSCELDGRRLESLFPSDAQSTFLVGATISFSECTSL